MRTIRGVLSVVLVAALAACSKGGGSSGVEGTWHLDLQPMIDAQLPAAMERVKAEMGAMEQLKNLPPEQREMALKAAEEQTPPEYRPLLKAMLAGEAETKAAVADMVREQMKGAKGTVQVKGDNTWTGVFEGMGDREEVAGTWSKDGSNYTFTTKTKNGVSATGDDAKVLTLTLKGDRLEGTVEGNPVAFKR